MAALLPGALACNSNSASPEDPDDEDLCQPSEFIDMGNSRWTIDFAPWLEEGTNINFDPELGFLAIGEHAGATEGPDDEPIGGITLFFDFPGSTLIGDYEPAGPRCISYINSLSMSTTDARVGTSAEINPKTYQIADPGSTESCELEVTQVPQVRTLPSNRLIEFLYISQNRAHGWFCIPVQQVSPEMGEPFSLVGFFVARIQ